MVASYRGRTGSQFRCLVRPKALQWLVQKNYTGSNLTGAPNEDASLPKKVKQKCSYFQLQALCSCSINHYVKKVLFYLNVELLWCSHVGLLFIEEGKNTGWFLMQNTLLPNMPTLFMTSHAQTVKHKVEALTVVVFSDFQKSDFMKLDHKSAEKLL